MIAQLEASLARNELETRNVAGMQLQTSTEKDAPEMQLETPEAACDRQRDYIAQLKVQLRASEESSEVLKRQAGELETQLTVADCAAKELRVRLDDAQQKNILQQMVADREVSYLCRLIQGHGQRAV